MCTQQKYFSSPGSWPNAGNDLPDDELVCLAEDQLRAMVVANFRAQWDAAGGRLDYLSAGDPGMWKDWIRIPAMRVIRTRLGLMPLTVQGYADILGMPRSAKHVTAEKIGSLGYERLYQIAYPEFLKFRDEKRKEAHEKGLKFREFQLRVGVASPLDWGMLVNNYAWGLGGFVQAVANEVNKILAFVDADDMVLSYESPFGQILTALGRPFGLGRQAARYSARLFEQVLDLLNKPVGLSLHPCWGDFKNQSLIEGLLHWLAGLGTKPNRQQLTRRQHLAGWLSGKLQSPKAIVLFLNPMQHVTGTQLREVLLNLVAGSAWPSRDPKDYAALRGLVAYGWIKYVAGLCHKEMCYQRTEQVARAAQEGSGITFAGFGPSCGLARVTADEAQYVVSTSLGLCDRV